MASSEVKDTDRDTPQAGCSKEFAGSSDPAGDKGSISCRYFKQGKCFRGVTCWYKHDISEINLKPEATEFVSRSFEPLVSSPTHGPPTSGLGLAYDLDHALGSEEERCSICFEDHSPTFGLLNNCSHAFCLRCIREWRSIKVRQILPRFPLQRTNPHKGCPLCRVTSLYVIPSRYFYKDGLAKQACVERYRQSLARKPCKYFQEHYQTSDGETLFCPFGSDCFYAHRLADGSEHVFEETAQEMMEKRKMRRLRHHLAQGLAEDDEDDDDDDEDAAFLAESFGIDLSLFTTPQRRPGLLNELRQLWEGGDLEDPADPELGIWDI